MIKGEGGGILSLAAFVLSDLRIGDISLYPKGNSSYDTSRRIWNEACKRRFFPPTTDRASRSGTRCNPAGWRHIPRAGAEICRYEVQPVWKSVLLNECWRLDGVHWCDYGDPYLSARVAHY